MHWKITGLGLALVATATGGLVMDHATAARADQAQRRTESTQHAANLLPDRPIDVPYMLVNAIAEDDYTSACFLFDEVARSQFTAARGVEDCRSAARTLAAEIRPGYRTQYVEYAAVGWSAVAIAPDGQSATVDACTIQWRPPLINAKPLPPDGGPPGPQIGRLSMRFIAGTNGGGFRVTNYEACATAPSSPVTSGTPSMGEARESAAAAPALLPSYAPGYGGVLAARLADGRSVCSLFSPAAATAFAAAFAARDCDTASTALAAQVTDRRRYRSPRSAPTTPGPRPVVDACSLRWPALGNPGPPGPQIGRLTLERPPGSAGYWVTGYQRC